jgi:hypothetical protein
MLIEPSIVLVIIGLIVGGVPDIAIVIARKSRTGVCTVCCVLSATFRRAIDLTRIAGPKNEAAPEYARLSYRR